MGKLKRPWKKIYYSLDLQKKRCEIQKCGKYQPSNLAVKITMNSVKTQAGIFRKKLWVLCNNKVLRRQQSLGLRLKILYPNEDIKEEYFALHYRTDFSSRNWWKRTWCRDPDYKKKDRKN